MTDRRMVTATVHCSDGSAVTVSGEADWCRARAVSLGAERIVITLPDGTVRIERPGAGA